MRRLGVSLRGRTVGLIAFIALSCLCLLLTTAQAQQTKRVFRVGVLSTNNPRSILPFVAFFQGLRDLGYVEGDNLTVEFRNAEGQLDRLPKLATELTRLPVDLIAAFGPEATLRAASQATRTIPIVMTAVNYDPLAKGYIASLARPGGNITGVFFMEVTLAAKRLSLLTKALPQVTRLFALYDVYSADQVPTTEAAAQSLGLQLQSLELINPPYDFDSATTAAVQERAEALVVLSSPVFYAQRAQIAALTVQHRLPALFLFRLYAEAGGLMSYGVSLNEMYQHAATYVDKILKGANPADLLVEQPTKFEFVINLKTAKQLGVTIPPLVLFQADKVIQ